jgi:uncharacterized protein (TIGR00251 family)
MANIVVRVVPNASKSCVVGNIGDCIKIKIQEPPHSSRANVALIKFLANVLGTSKSSISIISGQKLNRKHLSIDCPFTVDQIIAKLLMDSDGGDRKTRN